MKNCARERESAMSTEGELRDECRERPFASCGAFESLLFEDCGEGKGGCGWWPPWACFVEKTAAVCGSVCGLWLAGSGNPAGWGCKE